MYRAPVGTNTQKESADKTKNKIGGADVLQEEEEDALSVNFGRRCNTDTNQNHLIINKKVSLLALVIFPSDQKKFWTGCKLLIGGGKLKWSSKRLQVALSAAAALTQDTHSSSLMHRSQHKEIARGTMDP